MIENDRGYKRVVAASRVVGGSLVDLDRDRFRRELESLNGQYVEVTVRVIREPISQRAFRMYWIRIIEPIRKRLEDYGKRYNLVALEYDLPKMMAKWNKREVDHYLRSRFAARQWFDTELGQVVQSDRVNDMYPAEFSQYLNDIKDWAYDALNLTLTTE